MVEKKGLREAAKKAYLKAELKGLRRVARMAVLMGRRRAEMKVCLKAEK